MNDDTRRLRLRTVRREEPELGRLVEWVLNIAEVRHTAYLAGEPDPYGLPLPEPLSLAQPVRNEARERRAS
tara:strand:- start:1676 stop:1888 length:213 start_codon:yes stop_codon:yes gene_type:complete